jgi:dTDP-4-dehydrorhamnose reductase
MKRILVTGVSGFLGRYVAGSLQDRYHVLGTYRTHATALDGCELTCLDVADAEGVRTITQAFRPDVVVHTVALGDVDACEGHPHEAYRINVQGTEAIAQAAVALGARLIYISTDQVYDGVKGNYDEEDAPNPLMVYGRTKLQGERCVATICRDAVILRLALMYGWGIPTRLNFVDGLMHRLQVGQEVSLFVDQYRTPLYVVQAAEAIGRLINAADIRGTFNLGGSERMDRYAFGLKVCEVFDLPRASLKPIAMGSVGGLAARPRDCSMHSAKLSKLLQITPLTVEEGLQAMRRLRHGQYSV